MQDFMGEKELEKIDYQRKTIYTDIGEIFLDLDFGARCLCFNIFAPEIFRGQQ